VGLFGVIAAYVETLWRSLTQRFFPAKATPGSTIPPVKKNTASPAATSSVGVVPGVENQLREQITTLEKKSSDKDAYIQLLEGRVAASTKADKTGKASETADLFTGTTLTLLRYIHDDDTTLGLLYVGREFFCYTLEDTYRPEKINGKTRIGAGTYTVRFNEQDTPLTLKYRAKSYTHGWFRYHLQVLNVPGFEGIYIHAGKNAGWTEGCLLVGEDVYSEGKKKALLNSEDTFEKLYKKLAADLNASVAVRICIRDENWFAQELQNPAI
jgi:hypothetical protein